MSGITTALNPKEHFQESVGLMRSGRVEEAIQSILQFLEGAPTSIPHRQLLAHCYLKQNKVQLAKKAVSTAIEQAPEMGTLFEDLGDIEAIAKNYSAAQQHFLQALELSPQLPNIRKKLADIYRRLGDTETANQYTQAQQELNSPANQLQTGITLLQANKVAEAHQVFKKVLSNNPSNVDAMRLLALAEEDQGNPLAAEALLKQALSLAPEFTTALHNLGALYISQRKYPEAHDVFNRLSQLTPKATSAWIGLGNSLSHLSKTQQAVNAFLNALAIDDHLPEVHLVIAHQYKTLGQQDKAIAHYEKAIHYKPEMATAYWSMANLKTFRFSEAHLANMQLQLEEHTQQQHLSDDALVHFHFSLGKAFEDNKDYENAWHHYQEGNQVQRGLIKHDPVEHSLLHEEIAKVFNEDFYTTHRHQGYDDPAPIFILGLPRTGSTLIEQILASHSQVEGTEELPFIGEVAFGTGKFRADRLHYPNTLSTMTNQDLKALGQQYLRLAKSFRKTNKPFFIDKLPNNFSHVGFIKAILPNAKIINTRRHPTDSCLGVYRQLFAKGQHFSYDMFDLAEYYRDYHHIMEHWHRMFPDEILDVHYEDTVGDLESQVKRVLDFCGLNFEAACVNYHQNDRAVRTASSEQVRQPIFTTALARWRKYPDDVKFWQEQLADIIEQLPQHIREM